MVTKNRCMVYHAIPVRHTPVVLVSGRKEARTYANDRELEAPSGELDAVEENGIHPARRSTRPLRSLNPLGH